MTHPDTGTLAEIGAKVGDVVQHVGTNAEYEIGLIGGEECALRNGVFGFSLEASTEKYRMIKRADDTTKRWVDMTDAEQGALLLAHHRGQAMEYKDVISDKWEECIDPGWCQWDCYRVAPEPQIKTVPGDACMHHDGKWFKIAVNLIDGKPDWSTLRKAGE